VLSVRAIIGAIDEDRFRGRAVEHLAVESGEAARPRLRRRTDRGTDVALDLPRGSYLHDGAVLVDDGERIIVVERRPEDAAAIRFPISLPREKLIAQAVHLGHAFGNQHVPLEIEEGEVRVPVTTSRDVVLETARSAGVGVEAVRFARIPLGRHRPLGAAAHAQGARE
jgi:urease accessory protein